MSDRKTEILETAAEVLELKSFAAFSYQDLADRLGIRKASIHHHFPTKDDLGRALIAFYKENGDRAMRELEAVGSPGAALAGMFDISEQVLFDSPTRVCPSGKFEVDAEALSEGMRDAILQLKRGHLERVARLLAEARQAGEASFLGDPMDQSMTIMAAMQGAREAAPILGRDYFRAVIRQLKHSMGL